MKYLSIILFFIFIFSACQHKHHIPVYTLKNDKYIFITSCLDNLVDHYYLENNHYPKNLNELVKFLEIDKDSTKEAFGDPFHPGKLVKYIPVFGVDSLYPEAYFITSANANLSSVNEKNIDRLAKVFTHMQFDSFATNKPVIYIYSNKCLTGGAPKYKMQFVKKFRRNLLISAEDDFFLLFETENNFKIIDDKIVGKFSGDSLKFSGKLFSGKVKEYLQNHRHDTIELKAYKFNFKNDTVYLKNVMLYRDTIIPGYYFNEVGEPVPYPLSKSAK